MAPVAAFLASEACEVSGQVFAVGGGYVSRVEIVEAAGAVLGDEFGPEDVAAKLDALSDLSTAEPFANAMAAVQKALKAASS